MSKRSRNRSRRVASANAKRSLPRTQFPSRSNQIDLEDYLRSIEDRRTYHPEGEFRPARDTSARRHRLTLPTPAPTQLMAAPAPFGFGGPPPGVAFQTPQKVLVCVRRKIRKEVLHALGHSGKSGQKRPRRSAYSDIHC